MMKHKIFFILVLIFASFIYINNAYAQETNANFNYNYIISDDEILDYQSMSQQEIQNFLIRKGSYLANYSCNNAEGVLKKASEIIYEASTDNYDCDYANLSENPTREEKKLKCKPVKINPQFIIVLLQKEQGLIEDSTPKQSQLDWAVGYGCPDGQACNMRWNGFGKQVNSAVLQFYDYIINPQRYKYKAGQTYTVTNTGRDSIDINPYNRATAALYNYTPHVYNGNYNFYKLWKKYFIRSYLDGSLLQAKGDVGVWLIQNGKKRPFTSRGALSSRYDPNKIITVTKTDLEKYPTGLPIKFPQNSLVRSPKGTVFLIIDDKKRGFKDQLALRKVGINPEEIIDASWDDINAYNDGEPITASTTYATGALLQNNKTGGIYLVSDNKKAPILDKIILKTKFKYNIIFPVDPKKLDQYQTVSPVIFNDGELLKAPDSPGVYVISNGYRHSFTSGAIFESLGYRWTNIIIVPRKIIDLYPDGGVIKDDKNGNGLLPITMPSSASSTSDIASSTI